MKYQSVIGFLMQEQKNIKNTICNKSFGIFGITSRTICEINYPVHCLTGTILSA